MYEKKGKGEIDKEKRKKEKNEWGKEKKVRGGKK